MRPSPRLLDRWHHSKLRAEANHHHGGDTVVWEDARRAPGGRLAAHGAGASPESSALSSTWSCP
jgi:hypothetical protein